MIRISQVRKFDSANGNGIGVTVFCSGCMKRCKNCFNSELQSYNVGKELDVEEVVIYLKNEHVNHLSLLGGDFLDQDLGEVRVFLEKVREEVPDKKIWLWTGWVYQEMLSSDNYIDKLRCELIKDFVDYLVDGPYIESLSSGRILWRGSTNQIIYKRNSDGDLVPDQELMDVRI